MKHIKVELDFIPVEERLPRAGIIVFAFTKMSPIVGGYVRTDGIWMHGAFQGCPIGTVTHWAEIRSLEVGDASQY